MVIDHTLTQVPKILTMYKTTSQSPFYLTLVRCWGLMWARLKKFMLILIDPTQHGFVSGKSIETIFLLFQEYVVSASHKKKRVNTVYIDMSDFSLKSTTTYILISNLKS